jgi:hypothetical protein
MEVSFGVPYYLWNHAEPDTLLERVLSTVHLNHVTLPLVTGPRAQFRHACFPQAPSFETLGGWHYWPDGAHYELGGIRPITADWLPGDGPLGAVLDIAQRYELRVAVRLDLTEAPAILEQAQEALQQDAWGQTRFDHRACINQPRIRELIRATIADVLRFQPVAIQLENIELDARNLTCGWHDLGPRYRCFLPVSSMCFCRACRKLAVAGGVDPDAAAACERRRDTQLHAEPISRHMAAERMPVEPPLAEYVAIRAADLDRWLAKLSTSIDSQLWVTSYLHPFVTGRDRGRLAPPIKAIPSVWMNAWTWSRRKDGQEATVDDPPEILEDYAPAVPGAAFNLCISDVVIPAERFEHRAREFIRAGTRWIEFNSLEEAHRDALQWIRQIVTSIREHPQHSERLARTLERESRRIRRHLGERSEA